MRKVIFMTLFAVATLICGIQNVSSKSTKSLVVFDMGNVNIEALASYAGYCPNGCVIGDKEGCWCNGWYPDYDEYDWDKPETMD